MNKEIDDQIAKLRELIDEEIDDCQIAKLRELIGWWRAASNVMSEAEGDGPVRSSLRRCAKEVEDILDISKLKKEQHA